MERCLAIALDNAMTEAVNSDWMQALIENENKVRAKYPMNAVLKEDHVRITQCDLQALLKIFLYRSKTYFPPVFGHLSEIESARVKSIIRSLVDFRNHEIAHEAILEARSIRPGEYGYDNAILDMMTLLMIFPTVCGPDPVEDDPATARHICYYDQALQVYNQYRDEGSFYDYPMEEIIKEYELDISVEEFQKICDRLNIPVYRPSSKIWYLCSRDTKTDINRIKESMHTQSMAQALSEAKAEQQKAEQATKRAKQEADAARRAADQAKKDAAAARTQAYQAKQHNHSKKWGFIPVAVLIVILLIAAVSSCSRVTSSLFDNFSFSNLLGQSGKDAEVDKKIQEEIDSFVPSSNNNFVLKVGDGHTPSTAIWLKTGGNCYSTDESVVTVSSTGNVHAVGTGEAFVVIKASTGMYSVIRYTVEE